MNTSIRYTKVVEIDDEFISLKEVEEEKQSGCKSCDVKSSCGTHLLSEWLNQSELVLKLPKSLFSDAILGEHYSISVPDAFIVKMSMLNYTLPLLFAFMGAYLGSILGDLFSVFTFVIGLLIGIRVSRYFCIYYETSYLKFLHIIPTSRS